MWISPDKDKSVMDKSDMDKSDMDKSDMDKSDMDKSDVDKPDKDKSVMDKSDMDKSDMDKSDMDKSDADESDVDKSDMDKSDTDKVDHDASPISPSLSTDDVYYSDDRKLYHYNIKQNTKRFIKSGFDNYVVDVPNNIFYFTFGRNIYSDTLDNPASIVRLVSADKDITDMKFDPDTNVLFYSTGNNIMEYNIDQRRSRSLYSNLSNEPSVIGILPKSSYLVWVQGKGGRVRVMRGAMNGRSNYNPMAGYPAFNGEEDEIFSHPNLRDNIVYLLSGKLNSYDPTTRRVTPLYNGEVTDVILGPRDDLYFTTDSRGVYKIDPETNKVLYLFTTPDVVTDFHIPMRIDGESVDASDQVKDEPDMDKSDMDKSDMDKSDLDKYYMDKSDMDKSDKDKSDMDKSDMDKSDTDKSDKDKSDMDKSDVDKYDIDKSDKDKSDMDKSDMDKSNMDKSDMDKSDMDKSDMEKSNMDKSNTDESDVDKSDVDKSDMDKSDTDKVDEDASPISPSLSTDDVYYSDDRKLYHYNIKQNTKRLIKSGFDNYVVDVPNNIFYFTFGRNIYSDTLDNPASIVRLVSADKDITDMKFDPDTNVLFYSTGNNIMEYNIDQRRSRSLYSNLSNEPSVIGILPKSSYLVWVQGKGGRVRVMRGAMNGRSNYNPMAGYPAFNGEEDEIFSHPNLRDNIVYLLSGKLNSYDPRTRRVTPLYNGEVTDVILGPRDDLYFTTDSKGVYKIDPETNKVSYLFTTPDVVTDLHIPVRIDGESVDAFDQGKDEPDMDKSDMDKSDMDKFDMDKSDMDKSDIDESDMEKSGMDESDMEKSGMDEDEPDIEPSDVRKFQPYTIGSTGKRYTLVEEPSSYMLAQSNCRQVGKRGTLACPKNLAQQLAVWNLSRQAR